MPAAMTARTRDRFTQRLAALRICAGQPLLSDKDVVSYLAGILSDPDLSGVCSSSHDCAVTGREPQGQLR